MRRLLLAAAVLAAALPLTGTPAASAAGPTLDVTEVVGGLQLPWGLDFAPDGTMLFTERGGRWSSLAPPYSGDPVPVRFNDGDLFVKRETGLLDLLVDPDFATNRRVFTCQGHVAGARPHRIQVVSWRINEAYTRAVRLADPLVDDVTLWGAQRGRHGGCRLRFDGVGNLWIATGDGARSDNPQDLRRLGGKVLRVDPDTGAGVPGNPWYGAADPNRRRIWNFGHRNLQGLALRPGTTAELWTVEHGTGTDDEVNRVVKGRNYGWAPGPGYDESVPMTDLARFPNAVEAAWSSGAPTLATSGAVFLEGTAWGAWDGALVVACLKDSTLRVFTFVGDQIQDPVTVPGLSGSRLRTPTLGPDGALYVTTSDADGQDQILRVAPVTT